MRRQAAIIIIASICCAVALDLHAEEVAISKEMAAALKKFNPQFITWRYQDYSPAIQKDATKNKRVPYALELDVNADGKIDLILDGHDDKKSILLCLVSKSEGYDVVVIRERGLLNPNELENWNNGSNEIGLNYYLWPHEKGTGFTAAYPQQSDSEGNLLQDGVMIDYIFKDGEFQKSYQIL